MPFRGVRRDATRRDAARRVCTLRNSPRVMVAITASTLCYFTIREGESSASFPPPTRDRDAAVRFITPSVGGGAAAEASFTSNYPSERADEIVGMLRQFSLATVE